jgi:hydroxymethylglutaryl-CoA lyase
MSRRIEIVEVGPRDGLQNEKISLEVDQKLAMIHRLEAAGARRMEVVSFVNPRRVPQMAGAEEIMAALPRAEGRSRIGLVLNMRGWDRCVEAGCDEANVVVCATDGFGIRNQGASSAEQVETLSAIMAAKGPGAPPVSITISVAFGCPFEGEVDPAAVVELAGGLDADELVFADTIGVATPSSVRRLVERVRELGRPVGFHGHNTRNTGYANALAALDAGATVLDASIGGLGGCPYAPRATGNIATEDLVYLLDGEGIETGVDLDALVGISAWLEDVLGRPLEGQVYRAGASTVSA